MQGKISILERTPQEIDTVVKHILLAVYFEFVFSNRGRNLSAWEAGMDTIGRIKP